MAMTGIRLGGCIELLLHGGKGRLQPANEAGGQVSAFDFAAHLRREAALDQARAEAPTGRLRKDGRATVLGPGQAEARGLVLVHDMPA